MNIWFIISSRMNCMDFDKFFKPNMRRLIKKFKNLHMVKCGANFSLYYWHCEGIILIIRLYVDNWSSWMGNLEDKIVSIKCN